MPTPEEKIFNALKTKKDDEIISVIKDNPDLINLVTPNTKNSLMYMLLFTDKPKDFVAFFLTHPQFNFQFVNKNGSTNLEMLFQYGRVDVLPFVLTNPEQLVVQGKLTYVRAKEILAAAELNLAENKEFMFSAKSLEKGAVKISKLKQMIGMLHEPTINLAIKNDDPSILAQMEAAGANLRQPLSTGLALSHSIEDSNEKLGEWLMDYYARTLKIDKTAPQRAFSFFETEKKLQEAERKHQEELTKIYEESSENRAKRMDEVARCLK